MLIIRFWIFVFLRKGMERTKGARGGCYSVHRVIFFCGYGWFASGSFIMFLFLENGKKSFSMATILWHSMLERLLLSLIKIVLLEDFLTFFVVFLWLDLLYFNDVVETGCLNHFSFLCYFLKEPVFYPL